MSRSWDTPERHAQGKIFVFNNRGLPKIEFEKYVVDCKTRAEIDHIIATGPSRAGLGAFIEEFGDPPYPRRATRHHGRPRTLSPGKPLRYSSPAKCLPASIMET
jgi:hypothetical protein